MEANSMSNGKTLQQQFEIQSAFRLDFCSPAYLNSLLRQQHLHWLEIHRRSRGSSSISAVTEFLFVIPSSLANLVCVLGTEAPLLKVQLGCRLRRVATPDYVAPDGLQTFSVDYADGGACTGSGVGAHAKFLAALKRICVRLQLTNICLGPEDNRSCGDSGVGRVGCTACSKVRTHTKSVRGVSSASRFHRQPLLSPPPLPPPPQLQQLKPIDKAADRAAAALLAESAVDEILHRLQIVDAAIDMEAAAVTSARVALSYCGDKLIKAAFSKWRLHASAVSIFSFWVGQLADRLIAGCVALLARALVASRAAASGVAETATNQLIHYICTVPFVAELATAKRTLVRVYLLCDQQISRLLLPGKEPLRRHCPDCGTSFTAVSTAEFGGAYKLTVRSRYGDFSCHASLLQLADCARNAKDASLGSLLLQRIACLPSSNPTAPAHGQRLI